MEVSILTNLHISYTKSTFFIQPFVLLDRNAELLLQANKRVLTGHARAMISQSPASQAQQRGSGNYLQTTSTMYLEKNSI